MSNPIIIAGSGLAGWNVARELRKHDKEAALTVITADSGHFYSKPVLSNAIATGKTPATIPLSTPEQMAAQVNATVRPRTRITGIDPGGHTIVAGTEKLSYTKLVLALGSDQIRLPLAGDGVTDILYVNDLDDYTVFRERLEGAQRVAIIGGGLIGCEFANEVAATGRRVDVIELADQPLARLLPTAAAAFVERRLTALGVTWHFGTSLQTVERAGSRLVLTLAGGSKIETDLIVSAVGLHPRTQLARDAGITTNRGIVVDRHLQTSAADVFAIGDCMEIDGMVMPYVMPIMNAARALGATLAGKLMPVTFPAMPIQIKTTACPAFVSPPPRDAQGEWQVDTTEDAVRALYVDGNGKMIGYALLGAATAEKAKLTPQLPPVLV